MRIKLSEKYQNEREDICKKLGLSEIKDIPDDVTILTIRKNN